jgi:hypothetical protein
MPGPEGSSFVNPESPSSEAPKVIPMGDYPSGRGGMGSMPMGTDQPSPQSTERSQGNVEGRPPATKMPSA